MKESAELLIKVDNDGTTFSINWGIKGFDSVFEVLGVLEKWKLEYVDALKKRDETNMELINSVSIDPTLAN